MKIWNGMFRSGLARCALSGTAGHYHQNSLLRNRKSVGVWRRLHDYLALAAGSIPNDIMQLRKHVSTDKEGKSLKLIRLWMTPYVIRTLIAELSPTVLFDAGFFPCEWLAR